MLEGYSDVLTVKEVSQVLRIGLKKTYFLLHNKEISYKRIGRHYKISKDALIQYLSENQG